MVVACERWSFEFWKENTVLMVERRKKQAQKSLTHHSWLRCFNRHRARRDRHGIAMLEIEALLLSKICWNSCSGEQSIRECERLKRPSSSESKQSFWNKNDTNLLGDKWVESLAYLTTRETWFCEYHWSFAFTRASHRGTEKTPFVDLLINGRNFLSLLCATVIGSEYCPMLVDLFSLDKM